MDRQFDFVTHPAHVIGADLNLRVLCCIPAMVTGKAATASDHLKGAFCGLFGGDDAAAKGAAGWALHEKMGKLWEGLENGVAHWAVNTTSGKLMKSCI